MTRSVKSTSRDPYDGSLHLIHGFQRMKPNTTVGTLVPRRVRYMFVDRLLGDRMATAAMFKEHAVSSLKYESVELAPCSDELVIVKCSVKRKEADKFLRVMAQRHRQMQENKVRGYGDFCLGLHMGALKIRQAQEGGRHESCAD